MSAPLSLVNDVTEWFRDGDHWHGASGVPTLLGQHALLTLVSTVIAMAVGLPLAVWLGHRGRGGTFAVNLSNIGRAVPIVALLSLLSLGVFGTDPFGPFGRSGEATLVTLALFALPPIVTNTYTGMAEVDRDVVEAARGMGMRERQVLTSVELPLALPVVLGGVRTAAVQVVSTATLGAILGTGGLGRYLIDGVARGQNDRLFAGVVLVAGLALLTEAAFAIAQRALASPREPAGRRGRMTLSP